MPPALKALLAQTAGWLVALALARSGILPPGLWPLVATQAVAATAAAGALRSARWWLPIHLVFTPLVVAANRLGIAPGWYLAAFVSLVLIYWTSYRTQVPLYLSNRRTAEAIARLLPAKPARLLDIGAGTGSLLRDLTRLRPDCGFRGIELAPGPWLAGKLLLARAARVEWQRADLFSEPWDGYDLVYAFLSPVPMAAVWRKAAAEMRPGSLLVSNSFEVPERTADFVVDVDDRRSTRLLIYRIPARQATK
jgi:SAM-dependent methyltransferase